MAFISTVKMFLPMSGTTVFDTIAETALFGPSATITSQGLWLTQGDIFYSGIMAFDISEKISIGFWVDSINPGVINASTGVYNAVNIPILTMVGFGTALGDPYDDISLDYPVISVWEETLIGSENKLVVQMQDSTGSVLYQGVTAAYTSNRKHYFWIAFDGSQQTVVIFIDGVQTSLTETGTAPSTIDGNMLQLYINDNFVSDLTNVMSRYGYIDDIIVLSDSITSTTTLERLVNYDASYAFDTDYTDMQESFFGIFTTDPMTIKINTLLDKQREKLLARNDGKLFESQLKLWETKKELVTKDGTEMSSLFDSSDNAELSINGEFLTLTKGSINKL